MGRAVDLRQAAPDRQALRPRPRVPDHRDLQPRPRAALGARVIQRRAGHAGHRLPQRRRGGLQRASLAARHAARPRRERELGHGRLRHPRRSGPALFRAVQAARPGPAIPAAALPGGRGDGAPARRLLHRLVVGGTGVRGGARPARRLGQGPARAVRLAAEMDRSRALRMVLGRPPHPCRRLQALPGPHARRAARRHDAADPRRVAQRGVGADLGPVLLPPEAVLHRPGRQAVATGTADALRPGGLRLPVQPCRPSRAARAEGSGLSRHRARARSSASPTRAGACRSRPASCPTTRCPASTASAPTSTSWT